MKQLFLFMFLTFCLVSCQDKTAFDYNNFVVSKEKYLAPIIQQTERDVEQFIDKKKFDSVSICSQLAIKYFDEVIQQIEMKPLPSNIFGGIEYKNASLKYYNVLKEIYIVYKKYGDAIDSIQRNAAMEQMQETIISKDFYLEELQYQQIKFARDNHFKI